MEDPPPNNEMQQTRRGQDGASPLISVFDGRAGRMEMVRRIAPVVLSTITCLLLVAEARPVRAGGMDYLANIWVGGHPGINEFLRLDIRPDGTGSLTIQYRGNQPARAYRITATGLLEQERQVDFTVEPDEALAKPI